MSRENSTSRVPPVPKFPLPFLNPSLAQKERYLRLKKEWWQLTDSRKKAKNSIMNTLYFHMREQEALRQQIKLLEDEVQMLRKDVEELDRELRQQEIEFDTDGFIKVAPFPVLIESLYKEFNQHTPEFQNCFILTYRSFATANSVLAALRQDYEMLLKSRDPDAPKKRFRICSFLKKWTTENWWDFEHESDLLLHYSMFLQVIEVHDAKLCETLRSTFALKMEGRIEDLASSIVVPKSISVPNKITNVLDIDPMELARQMTIVDFFLYRQIMPHECLSVSWTKPDKEKRAPHIISMTKRFNKVTKWIVITLVNELDPARRIKLMQYFLTLYQHLLDLHNFHAVFMLNAAFYNSAISRLKAFRNLDKKNQRLLDELRRLSNPDSNRLEYRNTLHSCNPPCVPFLGMYQTDLTFIEDGNPDMFANGWVNLKKNRFNASVILDLQQFQQTPYALSPIRHVQEWLDKIIRDCDEVSDKTLYEISLKTEPRE